MISIIIPAHDEAAVIARSLQTLLAGAAPGELEIIAVCNGCSDNTAEVARRFAPAVRVIETDVPSKTNALNMGDAIAQSFPRIYMDADVLVPLDTVRALADRLAKGDIHAASPTPVINVTSCSPLVRAYYAIRSQLPSARQGLGGSGVYALSAAGRARFDEFPRITADDAFVRLHFSPTERTTIPSAISTVFAPRTLKDLMTIRTRIYFGNRELALHFPEIMANADATNNRALAGLLKRPSMWPAVATYLYVNIAARYSAYTKKNRRSFTWARDRSSREGTA